VGYSFLGVLMTRKFAKPAKTFQEQVQLLQSRGMLIDDVQEAIFYLQHLNYYRLGAYWLPFELDHATHQFKPNTKFKDVLRLYIFDRELRLLMLDGIERIEVSVRSQWAYHLATLHNPHDHLDSNLFKAKYWQKDFNALTEEVNRSQETFIDHLQTTYSEQLPPVLAVCEVMSIGLLSRWYGNLEPYQTRSAIAKAYKINHYVLGSWIHHLSIVRNFCAHHSRLWNREFSIIPAVPKSRNNPVVNQFVQPSRKIYNTLVIVLYFMDMIAPKHHLRSRLLKLLDEHPDLLTGMGFPTNWRQLSIWQDLN
jgi:abortive infection bacteriophage resistance protein